MHHFAFAFKSPNLVDKCGMVADVARFLPSVVRALPNFKNPDSPCGTPESGVPIRFAKIVTRCVGLGDDVE
jgi:hypothetical protein